jgi:hypothetical protein
LVESLSEELLGGGRHGNGVATLKPAGANSPSARARGQLTPKFCCKRAITIAA